MTPLFKRNGDFAALHTISREITLFPGNGSTFLSCDVYSNLNTSYSRYPVVHCKTEDDDFSLNLGLLDFGASYLFVITNVSSSWSSPLSPSIYLYH